MFWYPKILIVLLVAFGLQGIGIDVTPSDISKGDQYATMSVGGDDDDDENPPSPPSPPPSQNGNGG